MNRLKLKLLVTALIIIAPLTVLAQDSDGSGSGLSGSLQGGGYFVRTNSQLNSSNTDQINIDLDGPADDYKEIAPLASINIRYQFEGGTAIYAGNPLEVGQELALAAGLSQLLCNSTLDVAAIWIPIDEVWKNPYLEYESRDTTDLNAHGLRVKLLKIGGSPWEGNYYINRIDIDNDEIGDLEADLKRDGWRHGLGGKYTLSFDRGFILRPELGFSYGDIEGRSNSYLGVNGGVLLQHILSSWVLAGQVAGFYNQYGKTHPLFDKTRQEFGVMAVAQAVRMHLFGVEPLFASYMVGYAMSDANIDFISELQIRFHGDYIVKENLLIKD